MSTKSTAWSTFITTRTVKIRGAAVTHRKKGAIGTFKLFAEHETLAPFIEKLGNRRAAGQSIDAAAVRQAFDEVQAESGTGAGTLAIEIVGLLTRVVVDLVLDVAVVPSEELLNVHVSAAAVTIDKGKAYRALQEKLSGKPSEAGGKRSRRPLEATTDADRAEAAETFASVEGLWRAR